MKTAMQELIEQFEKIRENNSITADENIIFKSIISISKLYLEKEKQQIIEAYHKGFEDIDGERYYNETYTQ